MNLAIVSIVEAVEGSKDNNIIELFDQKLRQII